MQQRSYQSSFTLIEIIVVLSFTVLLFLTITLTYVNISRYTKRETKKLELAQNSRVILDRMSREIRQTTQIITALPETKDNPSNPPLSEIKFRDGHDSSPIQYIRYYQDNLLIKRAVSHYYFGADPDTWVSWDSVDSTGSAPTETITEDEIIGEYVENFRIYGINLIFIEMDLSKDQEKLYIKTSVGGRNL